MKKIILSLLMMFMSALFYSQKPILKNSSYMDLLFDAIADKNFLKVKKVFKNVNNINQVDKYGYSALHIASSIGSEEIALFLIANGINVNIQDKRGQTALHYTAVYNQLELAKKILLNGGDLSIVDIYGNQPLWTAVFNDKGKSDRIEFVKLYIEKGADINHKNTVDKSPRDIVTIAGYENLKSVMKIK
jgi:ankyrin repeat protein